MDCRSIWAARAVGGILALLLAASCAAVPTPFLAIPHDYTGGVKITRTDVPYGPNPSQRADLYSSSGDRGTIVFLHGGGWRGGHRTYVPSLLLHQVTRGWDLMSISYTLAGEAAFPAAVHDASDAVTWVSENGARHGLDTGNLVLSGWSAGANIAALAAYGANAPDFPGGQPAAVDRVLLLGGAYDMATVGFPYLDEPGGWLAGLRNGRHDASPNVWLDAKDPPTLAIHGVQDWVVPVAQVRSLAARSRAVGHGGRLRTIETSSPAFEERCRSHEAWCGAPVADVNRFLDGLPRVK